MGLDFVLLGGDVVLEIFGVGFEELGFFVFEFVYYVLFGFF